jgi:hypothetical protein
VMRSAMAFLILNFRCWGESPARTWSWHVISHPFAC